jgi:hypothetical protein
MMSEDPSRLAEVERRRRRLDVARVRLDGANDEATRAPHPQRERALRRAMSVWKVALAAYLEAVAALRPRKR